MLLRDTAVTDFRLDAAGASPRHAVLERGTAGIAGAPGGLAGPLFGPEAVAAGEH